MDAEIIIDSWNQYCDRTLEFDKACYRGITTVAYDLKTSIQRKHSDAKQPERDILREFDRAGRQWLDTSNKSPVFVMIMAQHYGAPTRLLDWTFSPLVALHFAVNGRSAVDGVVWILDYSKIPNYYPSQIRSMLNSRSGVKLSESDIVLFDVMMNDIPSIPLNPVSLDFSFQFLDRLEWFRDDFILLLEPDHHDGRISAQSSAFTLANKVDLQLHDYLQQRPGLYQKLIIPSGLKRTLRSRLDSLNISERSLFPGLDGLGRYLSRV